MSNPDRKNGGRSANPEGRHFWDAKTVNLDYPSGLGEKGTKEVQEGLFLVSSDRQRQEEEKYASGRHITDSQNPE